MANVFKSYLNPIYKQPDGTLGHVNPSTLTPQLDPSLPSGTPPSLGPIPTLQDTKNQIQQNPGYKPLSVQLASEFRSALGPAPSVNYSPITPQVSNLRPVQISGLSDDYFASQKEQLKDQLRQEFFGRNGQWDEAVSTESAAGRLGSGVARQMLQKTVTEPFTRASLDIDKGILQAVMQERARVENYNADQFTKYNELLARATEVDSTNKLAADQASANLMAEYNKLTTTLADAEAGRLSTEGIAQLEANIKVFQSVLEDRRKADALAIEQEKNRLEDFRKQQANMIEYLRTPIKPGKMSSGQSEVGNQLAGAFGAKGSDLNNPPPLNSYNAVDAPAGFPRVGSTDPRTGKVVSNGYTFTDQNGGRYMLVTGSGGNTWVRVS